MEARKRKTIAVVGILLVLAVLAAALFLRASGEKEPLPERSFFGFIRAVHETRGGLSLDIDEVEFLSGEAAVLAVMEDKGCPRAQVADCVPSMNNDFYIRNLSRATVSYAIAARPSISILGNPGSPDLSSTTAEAFPAQFADASLRLNQMSFRFTSRGGVIEAIEEQYTP